MVVVDSNCRPPASVASQYLDAVLLFVSKARGSGVVKSLGSLPDETVYHSLSECFSKYSMNDFNRLSIPKEKESEGGMEIVKPPLLPLADEPSVSLLRHSGVERPEVKREGTVKDNPSSSSGRLTSSAIALVSVRPTVVATEGTVHQSQPMTPASSQALGPGASPVAPSLELNSNFSSPTVVAVMTSADSVKSGKGSGTGMTVRIEHDFTAESERELTVKKGDIL
jgi:hypothetical protein